MAKKLTLKGAGLGVAVGSAFALVTSWLFYDLEPVSLALLAVLPFFAKTFEKRRTEKRMQELETGFKDALQYMRNGLDAGYSPEHSLCDAARELGNLYGKKSAIAREFAVMAGKLSTGATMEQAFAEFAGKTDVVCIREFADLFRILKRTGGNLNRVIRRTVSNLNDSLSLRRDLNVVTAAKRSEFNIMSAIPYGILLYLKLLAPEMSAPLYHSSFGMTFMTVVLVCSALCFWFGHSVIRRTLRV